jgi:AcrR family transcriptional regulator
MPRKPDPDARRKLAAAARAAFGEVGVDAARIEDVARAAGLSKGAFYLHFSGKEEVLTELVGDFFAVLRDATDQQREVAEELRARLGAPTAEDFRTGSARLAAWRAADQAHIVRLLQVLWRHRDILRVVLAQTVGPRRAITDTFFELARQFAAAQIEDAARAGALRDDLDADIVSELVIGMFLHLGRRMAALSARPDFDAWARAASTLMLEGLAVRVPLAHADSSVSQGA